MRRSRPAQDLSHRARLHRKQLFRWLPNSIQTAAVSGIGFFTLFFVLSSLPFLWTAATVAASASAAAADIHPETGPLAYAAGQQLFQRQEYEAAAAALWRAVLLHTQTPEEEKYNIQSTFQMFLQCYAAQNKLIDGFLFVAEESFLRGQKNIGHQFLNQASQLDPMNVDMKRIRETYVKSDDNSLDIDKEEIGGQQESLLSSFEEEFTSKTPEELYSVASLHFSNKEYEDCADVFELSCFKSGEMLAPSCANAVYCRTMIIDWGFNGTWFESDMSRIVNITRQETQKYRLSTENDSFVWRRATSVHPHMMLGYPVDPILKRMSAESVAYMDEKMARVSEGSISESLPHLPPDMPFSMDEYRIRFSSQKAEPSSITRIGFVGSGFNSKAVLFLSHDMFRFFNSTKFEVHVFSFGPPDNPMFIKYSMRGVDWRKRVQDHVHHFHDCQQFSKDHIAAARYIHQQSIHILIEWDGYARQGARAQGLFALRPAPVQMLHQEYVGTSGALYVDYLFSDLIASPLETHHLYSEKIIYLPNHFFSKGHTFQDEVKQPSFEYLPQAHPYKIGTGRPSENRCLAPKSNGLQDPSFVFCNFNKFLKNNPQTVRSWIRILREVPNSMLCLLENPKEGIPYFRKFVHEAAGTLSAISGAFEPGDGDALNERIHFLPWEQNPFDHQMRNQDFCNVMLDSFPYNGHTVAQDSLYGGVPIVTRSDGQDMSSRVTTSSNVVLGLEELNAYGGNAEYEEIAIRLGTNTSFYERIRRQLLDTCLQRNPVHPYWDVARYVSNFEAGLEVAWQRFLDGNAPDHIFVAESDEVRQGTFDEKILAHPQEKQGSTLH